MKEIIAFKFPILLIAILLLSCIELKEKKLDNDDYVPNEETAIKIAEAVWLPIYGKKIYKNEPFEATLMNDSVWVVMGTLKEQKGGVPYIEIRKKDCKILKVIHGK
ncbi:YbbC/YhhH family protein [Paradesertivirga mongoliensis]|uniref:YbbC/YhhH family protein n=2 Tax=Paradesertivirga mongoliensis TaxID=2100740 RepID=A0ABW4ZKG5_9SPHI